jgi:crossover junction endodeoxyribonuclease RuvC
MSRIIGIDPGLSATGYGIIEAQNNTFTSIAYGVITTKSSDPTGSRLGKIHNELTRILVDTKPDEASVELLYFAKNLKSAIPVAQARGVILLACHQAGVPAFEYTPLEVKQAVVGRGRADKTQVQTMMKLLLHLDKLPSPDHAADALAIAFCHSSFATARGYLKTGTKTDAQ